MLPRDERPHCLTFARKVLYSLMVITGLASTITGGTFASFSAGSTNGGSSIATGTLVLGRELNSSGTFCLSTGAGTSTDTNANTGCTVMLNTTTVKLGDAATTADLTLRNDGTLPGTLYYRSSACTNAVNVPGYAGTGNICSQTNLIIQEYTTAARTAPVSACVYPAQPASSCPLISAATAPTYLPGNLPTTDLSQGAIAAGALRYFRLSIQLPNRGLASADAVQGRKATFGLTWTLVS